MTAQDGRFYEAALKLIRKRAGRAETFEIDFPALVAAFRQTRSEGEDRLTTEEVDQLCRLALVLSKRGGHLASEAIFALIRKFRPGRSARLAKKIDLASRKWARFAQTSLGLPEEPLARDRVGVVQIRARVRRELEGHEKDVRRSGRRRGRRASVRARKH